jgi:hypothetical protein
MVLDTIITLTPGVDFFYQTTIELPTLKSNRESIGFN